MNRKQFLTTSVLATAAASLGLSSKETPPITAAQVARYEQGCRLAKQWLEDHGFVLVLEQTEHHRIGIVHHKSFPPHSGWHCAWPLDVQEKSYPWIGAMCSLERNGWMAIHKEFDTVDFSSGDVVEKGKIIDYIGFDEPSWYRQYAV